MTKSKKHCRQCNRDYWESTFQHIFRHHPMILIGGVFVTIAGIMGIALIL